VFVNVWNARVDFGSMPGFKRALMNVASDRKTD